MSRPEIEPTPAATPPTPVAAGVPDPISTAAAGIAAAGDSRPRLARDPVNQPMIRNWVEAIGGSAAAGGPGKFNAAWGADEAPPAMIQVWTMPGLHGVRGDDDPLALILNVLDAAGYTSIVATNSSQEYHRYLKVGEQLAVRSRLLDVVGPKRTALGEGWFVTTRSTWYSGDEPVGTMDFRVLKFRPDGMPAPAPVRESPVMRPVVSRDTEFFWDGTRVGELRVQRCAKCGALRHPPGPMCPSCGTAGTGDYIVVAGTGEVYSYVVHHHPPVPGKQLPLVIALVQLPEGVRMVGELLDVKPGEVRIGQPVQVDFDRIDDAAAGGPGQSSAVTLPVWRAAEPGALPPLRIDVTPTFVISSALATRDFQDVHHDRDAAVARGSKDIFLNILTTTGLVQRYVTDCAGPDVRVRAISIRLGVPCYAGDTLTLTGRDSSEGVIEITGRCSLGNHVVGTVRIQRLGEGS
ncbi:MAG TPA: OB-fold domain-containing protein [Streptosporangiaceae bacterium]